MFSIFYCWLDCFVYIKYYLGMKFGRKLNCSVVDDVDWLGWKYEGIVGNFVMILWVGDEVVKCIGVYLEFCYFFSICFFFCFWGFIFWGGNWRSWFYFRLNLSVVILIISSFWNYGLIFVECVIFLVLLLFFDGLYIYW